MRWFCGESLLLFFHASGEKPCGVVYLPRTRQEAVFNGLDEMLFQMARLREAAVRIEVWPDGFDARHWPPEKRGALLNISIQILSEKNHTWQGILKVVELKRNVIFRSAMELLELLTEAIEERDKSGGQARRYWHEPPETERLGEKEG